MPVIFERARILNVDDIVVSFVLEWDLEFARASSMPEAAPVVAERNHLGRLCAKGNGSAAIRFVYQAAYHGQFHA